MREILLSQNKTAFVDDEDFPLLAEFRWCYRGERDGNPGYAVRHRKVNGKDRLAYLHREIMNPPPGQEVIFLNHDRLDCRKENLRIVTSVDARRHHRVRRDSKSGIKGVRFNPDGGTWSAYTYRHGHCYSIGTYYTLEQAYRAYEDAMSKENPDLANAPARVERRSDPVDDEGNPDARQQT